MTVGVMILPNVGLVLSGGFAKGAYQIGVLNALKETFQDEQVNYICASSIGALNAYAFVHNKMDIAENIWRSIDFSGFRSLYKTYSDGTYIAKIIDEIMGETDFPQPNLYISCLNITKIKLNYINLKNVRPEFVKDYLLASVMVPIFSRAVEISGMKYVDGAVIDNIPIKPLMNRPLDYAIVVHFDNQDYRFENPCLDRKLIKITFPDNKLIRTSLAFDQESITHMIEVGYERAISLFEVIFKNGVQDTSDICQRIEFINGAREKQIFRLTGDVVLNNTNKVLKKIISSNI